MEIVMSQQNIKKTKYCLHAYQLQRGTTIVEAIVAIFVLSFGVLALMLAQITAVNTSINAANQSEVTRAVQNYVEEMRSYPKLTIQEKLDGQGNKIQSIAKDYSQYAINNTAICANKLDIHLVNANLNTCIINTDGQITVTWGGQSLSNDDTNDEFSYSLTAGQS
jgi:type IV pilus modification protein PilV